jgi:hypothetical protein
MVGIVIERRIDERRVNEGRKDRRGREKGNVISLHCPLKLD